VALGFITYKDAQGVSRSIAVDSITGGFAELLKLAFSAAGADPILVSSGNPLPIADAAVAAALASILTELGQKLEPADLSALASATKQDAAKAVLDAIAASVDGLESNTAGLATQTTLAAVLAKLTADPATQTTLAAVLAAVDGLESNTTGLATQTTLAAVLAKLTSDPATGAKQDTLAAKDFATQTPLAAILAKLIASPATEATLGTVATNTAKPGDLAATLTNGRKTSTTVGTAVALRTTLACKWVTVTALRSNTTDVAVGGSGVLATAGSATGVPLAAGESVTIPIADAATVFVDVLTSGEGVSFVVGI
jgi:hypothetical protein